MNVNTKIEEYTGTAALARLSPELCELASRQLDYIHEAFGDNVEYEICSDRVLFCERTRDYLMREPKSPEGYIRGMRPVLEEALWEATRGCKTEPSACSGFFVTREI